MFISKLYLQPTVKKKPSQEEMFTFYCVLTEIRESLFLRNFLYSVVYFLTVFGLYFKLLSKYSPSLTSKSFNNRILRPTLKAKVPICENASIPKQSSHGILIVYYRKVRFAFPGNVYQAIHKSCKYCSNGLLLRLGLSVGCHAWYRLVGPWGTKGLPA